MRPARPPDRDAVKIALLEQLVYARGSLQLGLVAVLVQGAPFGSRRTYGPPRLQAVFAI
jgi:hypothetical protein